jgi:hypothetical protein
MPAMFQLELLLLAKVQWDVRQCPDVSTWATDAQPWPAQAVARGVPLMVSPCVAGELLQQRAPQLLPHVRRCKRQLPAGSRQRQVVTEEGLVTLAPFQLGILLQSMSQCLLACSLEDRVFATIGEQGVVPDPQI